MTPEGRIRGAPLSSSRRKPEACTNRMGRPTVWNVPPTSVQAIVTPKTRYGESIRLSGGWFSATEAPAQQCQQVHRRLDRALWDGWCVRVRGRVEHHALHVRAHAVVDEA